MKLCKISTTGVVARAVLPLFLLCEATTPAHSADWRFTAIRSTHYGTSLAFIDVSSVRGGNGRVSFWASTYFSRSTRGMNRVSALVTAQLQHADLSLRPDRPVLQSEAARPLGIPSERK